MSSIKEIYTKLNKEEIKEKLFLKLLIKNRENKNRNEKVVKQNLSK